MVPAGQAGRRGRRPGTAASPAAGSPVIARLRRWRGLAVALAVGLLTLAACTPKPSGTKPHAHSPRPVTVVLAHGSLGAYLADGDGLTLYLFQPDPPGKSTCDGSCAQFWPPLLGVPVAGFGLSGRQLSTTARHDGTKQVVYHGHPLYYYFNDKQPGQITGQGVNANGGLWYMVDAAGDAITTMPSPSPGDG